MRKLSISIALSGLILTGTAAAAPATGSFDVNATVGENCRITGATDIDFGAYDPLATSPTDQTGTITVQCVQGSDFTIALDQGGNPDAGSTAAAPLRRMTGTPGGALAYQIYSDSGYSTVWGDNGSNPGATAVSLAGIPFTTYGRIAAGQDVPVGGYTDTVGVTVTF